MRVHIVDPSAYTPPYDHALCSALAAQGAQVRLYTSRFAYGAVAAPDGYERVERFYRLAARAGDPRVRRALKLVEHVPDMLGYRREARACDVVHFQWLTVQHLDGRLMPRGRPLVLTAHDILPREALPGQRAAQRRLYARFDAIVVHSEHGARRLTEELGVDAQRVHVIPHGALAHLTAPHAETTPPPFQTDAKVVLMFGLMRPYKGIDLLLDAWGEGIAGAELWIVGMPRMDIAALRVRAQASGSVRVLARYVDAAELAGCFARADVVVLPYREIDQSGVLFTALAYGKPMLLSDVGGFPELAATGAARLFPSGDAAALRAGLQELLADDSARARMASAAREAATGAYSWETAARRTLALYEALLGPPVARTPEHAAR